MTLYKLRKIHVHFLNNDQANSSVMKESQAFLRKLKAEKRESNFELIKSIMKSMSSTEIRFAKNYLQMLHRAEFDSQTLKLFRYILNNADVTEAEARRDFSMENSKINFDSVASTLKKRLGWSLVSEYNTQREEAYSYKWMITFEAMNNLALYHVVITRSVSGYALDLLNDIISKTRDVEAYRELTFALELKIKHVKARSEGRALTKLENELDFYRRCEQALKQATLIYYEIGGLSRKQGISQDELLAEYSNYLKSLSSLYEQSNSSTILSYCLFAKSLIYQVERNFNAASKTLHKLYELHQNSLALNSNLNMGMALAFLTDNYIKSNEFDIALTYCKKTKSYFAENSFNYFQAEYLEFHCQFYTNKFYVAEKKMKGILNNPNLRESTFLINIKKYLLACTLFAQAKYRESLSILLNLEKIWSDTTGWNVGIRTLIMLSYKMIGDYELMAIERERFRQLFDKYRHRTAIRERDRIILKIIHEFLKRNSDFKSVLQRKHKDFDLLTKQYKWEPLTHEMIVFEQWFICIANKKPYKSEL